MAPSRPLQIALECRMSSNPQAIKLHSGATDFSCEWRSMNEYKPKGGDFLLALVLILLCMLIAALVAG
jgi:hypothetical protein